MKRYKETHRDNLNTHMAIYDHGKPIVHPTLFEYQIFETHQQIDILLTQLDIVANQRADSDCYKDEQRSKETSITMNISLIYEDLSHLYESSGKPKDALESIVTASQSLFFEHCYILNSLMGWSQPHEARLYQLDDRCKELCQRHPELWEVYHNSNMHYLIEEQHLWPCE